MSNLTNEQQLKIMKGYQEESIKLIEKKIWNWWGIWKKYSRIINGQRKIPKIHAKNQ